MRPSVALVDTTSFTAVTVSVADPRVERLQVDRDVVAGEGACEPLLEVARRHRAQEADPPEVHADHRDARPEVALQRAQHGPVAAEHNCEIGLVVRQLDSGGLRDRAYPLDRSPAAPAAHGGRSPRGERAQPTAAAILLSMSSARRGSSRWTS